MAKNADLNIEEVPITGYCNDCKKGFTVEEQYVLSCPFCHGTSFEITGGRELDIIDIEVT